MPRIKELVRIATLGRHFEQGLVASVEIIDDGGRWSVRVHYNERAEGPKTRFLTSQRKPGPKQYACFYTVWRVLTEHGITTATINKVTPKNTKRISTEK